MKRKKNYLESETAAKTKEMGYMILHQVKYGFYIVPELGEL